MSLLFRFAVGTENSRLESLCTEFNFPVGVIPENFLRFKFDRNFLKGDLVVYLPGVLDVTYLDGTMLRFEETISGQFGQGNWSDLKGIKIRMPLFWSDVKSIYIEEDKPERLNFQAIMTLSKNLEVFEKQREGVFVG